MSISKLLQIKSLINLARIDGEVAEKERTYIYTIGKANGISENVITPLFNQDHEIIIPTKLSKEEKFQYIFSLVQLMKIDERLYKNEIQYCAKVTSRLGYSQEALFDLMLHVNPSSSLASDEAEVLKKLIAKHLQ
jgi:uncharacterized tellurite resistance protein B-like protein